MFWLSHHLGYLFLMLLKDSEAELASDMTFVSLLIIVLLLTMPPTMKYTIYSPATVSPTCQQLLLRR